MRIPIVKLNLSSSDQDEKDTLLGALLALIAVLILILTFYIFMAPAEALGEELPNAPEAVGITNDGGYVRPVGVKGNRTFTKLDWTLVGAEFAVRTGDLITTMQCQHASNWEQFQTGIGAGTYWKNVGCREYELPQSFVGSWKGMALYSYGIAGVQTVAQWELTRHGHRTMARRLAIVSVGFTGGTVISNKIMQGGPGK